MIRVIKSTHSDSPQKGMRQWFNYGPHVTKVKKFSSSVTYNSIKETWLVLRARGKHSFLLNCLGCNNQAKRALKLQRRRETQKSFSIVSHPRRMRDNNGN